MEEEDRRREKSPGERRKKSRCECRGIQRIERKDGFHFRFLARHPMTFIAKIGKFFRPFPDPSVPCFQRSLLMK